MSMPDTLTIYKVPFGEDGFLLSFIEPPFGSHEEEEYIKMSIFNEIAERLLGRVKDGTTSTTGLSLP